MGKRELVALLCLSSWCLMSGVWLFLVMLAVCQQFIFVVFPDHTHYCCFHLCVCLSSKATSHHGIGRYNTWSVNMIVHTCILSM